MMFRTFLFCIIILISIDYQVIAQKLIITANEVCYGNSTNLSGSSTDPDSVIASWLWDMDNDGFFDDASGKFINYLFNDPDTFYVKLKVISTSGVADSMNLPEQVIVNPVPDVNFHVDNLCAGSTATYRDKSSIKFGKITQYNWDFNNDNIVDDNSGSMVTFANGLPGNYITKLECESDKGCKDFTTKSTNVFGKPEAKYSFNKTCWGDKTEFINKSIAEDSVALFIWDFDDNGVQAAGINVNYTFSDPKTYNVKLIALNEGFCTDTFITVVIIKPVPDIEFSYSSDTVIYEGNTITITASGNTDSYLWSNGGVSNSITVSEKGTYTLTAGLNGCNKIFSSEIIVKDRPVIDLKSNLITPNGDGINDFLIIDNIETLGSPCEIYIYDTRNELVYENKNYQNDFNGSNLIAGTYYYLLKYKDDKKIIGSFNVLK